MLADNLGELFAWIFAEGTMGYDTHLLRKMWGPSVFKKFHDLHHRDVGNSSTGNNCPRACPSDQIEASADTCPKRLFNFRKELRGVYAASATAV